MEFEILPAEYIGEAAHDESGFLTIGCGEKIVKIHLTKNTLPGWFNRGSVSVFVRRLSTDLSVAEIHIAQHDGLDQEQLEYENHQAEIYPLGAKEYWRAKMVGKYTYGLDSHLMTNDEFEKDWNEIEEDL